MKRILLDECIDERLRHKFAGYECQTARYAGLSGMKNGQLLDAARAAGFDVIVTVDQNIPHQQNVGSRSIAIVVLRAATSRLNDLTPIIPQVLEAIQQIRPRQVAVVPSDA